MATSIPASAIVSVLPDVISAGGSGLDLVGMMLTNSAQMPTGTILSFSSAPDVATYFGPASAEASLATTYFAGYDGSAIKPAKLLFYRYVYATAAAAFLRGGSVASLSLTALQALSGTLIITVDGVVKTSSTINLSAATSFSNAATIIAAAFTTPGFAVTYDSISGGFLFTDSTTGTASTLTYATGTLANGLKLTAALGATLSAGANTMNSLTVMDGVLALTQDFVSFMTVFTNNTSDKVAFAQWANGKNDRWLYVGWDGDINAATNGDTSSFGSQVQASGWSGTVAIYDPNNGANVAAFVMGAIASINFTTQNGRATLAFRTGTILPGVTNQSIGDNLAANGYNYVGAYATANDRFVFFYPGQVSGQFDWIDSWISQVWMNTAFQLDLMTLLTSVGSIPYNDDGKALIAASLRDQVNAAINFGAIRVDLPLSTQQKAEINNQAGGDIADTVEQRGWYILVGDAAADVRAARGSPPVFVWYVDGGSVQKITLASVLVQ